MCQELPCQSKLYSSLEQRQKSSTPTCFVSKVVIFATIDLVELCPIYHKSNADVLKEELVIQKRSTEAAVVNNKKMRRIKES